MNKYLVIPMLCIAKFEFPENQGPRHARNARKKSPRRTSFHLPYLSLLIAIVDGRFGSSMPMVTLIAPITHFCTHRVRYSLEYYWSRKPTITMVSSFSHLCLVAILCGAVYHADAQLSTIPRRYRHAPSSIHQTSDKGASSAGVVLGRPIRKESENIVMRKTRQLVESEELSMSMALETNTFDLSLSVPSLDESEFGSMSLLLEEAELSLSLSLPMFEDSPTEPNIAEPESETASLETSNAASTLILSSFITGLSALVIGATAMFLKMKRLHAREVEQDEPRIVHDMRVENFEVAV